MATREENIKKINPEAMNDEELDQVTGGTCSQIAEDSRFLYELGIIDDWYTTNGIKLLDWSGKKTQKVVDGWDDACVICKANKENGFNEYYHAGEKISQGEAWDIARAWVKAHKS